MADEKDIKRIDTSLPFNDDLPSSNPSAKTVGLVLGGIALAIMALIVIFR